jgi:hypothetical protein
LVSIWSNTFLGISWTKSGFANKKKRKKKNISAANILLFPFTYPLFYDYGIHDHTSTMMNRTNQRVNAMQTGFTPQSIFA